MSEKKGPSSAWARNKKAVIGGSHMNRNPSGLIIPTEYRGTVKTEVLQAVRDRYPAGSGLVWNLSVIDQVTENPGKYPVANKVMETVDPARHRQIVSNILRCAGFEPDNDGVKRCPYFRKPAGFDDMTIGKPEKDILARGAA